MSVRRELQRAQVAGLLLVALCVVLGFLYWQSCMEEERLKVERDAAFAERRQALAWVFYFWAHSKNKMPESHQLAMIRSFRERFPTYDEDPCLASLAEQALMFRRGMSEAKDLEAAYRACLEE